MASRPLTPRQITMMTLAERREGCSNFDLQQADGCSPGAAHGAMNSAMLRGRVVMVSHPSDPKHRLRAFTSPALAKGWQAGPAPSPQRKDAANKAPQGHSWRPAAAGPTRHTAGASKMAADAPSAPVTASKITQGASPAFGIAARYYVDPATVQGPFTAVGVGRDVQTGKAWGAPA